MKKLLFLLIFLPSALLGQTFLKPLEFQKALRENQDAVLLDFRNINLFMLGHIKNASLVEFMRDDLKEYFLKKYKPEQKLFLYSQHGSSTEQVALFISEIGFENLMVLEGGFEKWISESRPYKSLNQDFKPLSFISKQNFMNSLREKEWVLVLFQETVCAECSVMMEEIKDLENKMDNFKTRVIDFEVNAGLAEDLGIIKNPTVILYKNGIQYWKKVGTVDQAQILSHVY